MITITETAQQYLNEKIEENDADGIYVSFNKTGCSGYEYTIDYWYANNKNNGKISATMYNGIFVVTDTDIFHRLIGTTIDIEDTAISKKIVFLNPNVKSVCGCGASVEFDDT